MPRLRIFTWHIHGSYLFYLSQVPFDIFIPVKPGRPDRYFGRTKSYPWPDNLHEVAAEEVRDLAFDCVLYQHSLNYSRDQYDILSPAQMRLPRVFLEHDPPQQVPTDTRHPVDDPEVLIVHVTHFNALMWDNGPNAVRVIDHGIKAPNNVNYTGALRKGLTIVNNLLPRGRRLGLDVYQQVRREIPLELIGMGWNEVPGGIGEVSHSELFQFAAQYRFLFNPIRYTSLGLAVLEAMSVGVPVVGLATTEMVTAVQNGVNGFVSTNVAELLDFMQQLLDDVELARRLSNGARSVAAERFNITRFVDDWSRTFEQVI